MRSRSSSSPGKRGSRLRARRPPVGEPGLGEPRVADGERRRRPGAGGVDGADPAGEGLDDAARVRRVGRDGEEGQHGLLARRDERRMARACDRVVAEHAAGERRGGQGPGDETAQDGAAAGGAG